MENSKNKDIIKNIQGKIFGKSIDEEFQQIRLLTVIWRRFNLSWNELMDMPLPRYKYLIQVLEEEVKEENERNKKR